MHEGTRVNGDMVMGIKHCMYIYIYVYTCVYVYVYLSRHPPPNVSHYCIVGNDCMYMYMFVSKDC